MPASLAEVLGGLVLLSLALVPTGLSILRVIEVLLRHTLSLSPVERIIVAFYSAGFLFFVLASVPLQAYGNTLVAATLILGTSLYVCLLMQKRAAGFRAVLRVAQQPAVLLLLAGTVGLLLFEVFPVWNHPFPNAWDGSVTALWMTLTLHQGTLPTSLAPFASAPVVYPLAATVWMTLPVLILGWPVVQATVLLPPLFLSLTVPAAYIWGARWGGNSTTSGPSMGLLFAAFFGIVAGWPRFYTGGSYDFAFALPLFLVALGLVPSFVRIERIAPSQILAFGLLAGVLASLSLAAGEALVVLVLAYSIVIHRKDGRILARWLGRTAIVVGFEVVFTLRSVVAWAVYGAPGYSPTAEFGSLNQRLVEGELDPFVPWKDKLSPFPWMSFELQLLLVVGLVLASWALLRGPDWVRLGPFSRFASDLLVGTVAMFAFTGFLLVTAVPSAAASDLRGVTNLDQSSILFFVFLEAGCVFPLALGLRSLARPVSTVRQPIPPPRIEPFAHDARVRQVSKAGRTRTMVGAVAILILVIPLATGSWFTLSEGYAQIQQNVGKTSNVTAGDVAAMEWIGNHLPSCSGVLVAPGSAGQFLPEYASVRLVLPMNPIPSNRWYSTAIEDLTTGVYDNGTRTALLALQVTDVFVTGQTSVSFPAIPPSSIESSPDFHVLTFSGDALLLGFLPGESAMGCPV